MHCKELIKGKKWVCVADGPKDPVTGKRKQISRRGKTKSAAAKKVQEALASLKDFGVDEKIAEKITIAELGELWLKEYRLTGVKRSTIDYKVSALRRINSYIGSVKIGDLSLHQYQSMLNDIFEKAYATSSLGGYHTTVTMMYRYALKHKMVKESPIKDAFLPKKKLTVDEIENKNTNEKFFEREELEEFLETTATKGLLFDMEYFHVAAFSGMRPGEICALKWPDINFEENKIRITKTVYSPTNNMFDYEVTTPKTNESIRTIEMDAGIMDMLADLKTYQDKVRSANYKKEGYHDAGFVFSRPSGHPYLVGFFVIRMKRLMKKTTIKKHATPHIMRHTHVSMLTEADADLNYIMNRVGHKNARITREVYTHVSKKMKKTVSEDMHKKFGDIVKSSALARKEK